MADDSQKRRAPPPAAVPARQDRLAAALRANLAKRKAQARERAVQTPPKPDKTP